MLWWQGAEGPFPFSIKPLPHTQTPDFHGVTMVISVVNRLGLEDTQEGKKMEKDIKSLMMSKCFCFSVSTISDLDTKTCPCPLTSKLLYYARTHTQRHISHVFRKHTLLFCFVGEQYSKLIFTEQRRGPRACLEVHHMCIIVQYDSTEHFGLVTDESTVHYTAEMKLLHISFFVKYI